MSLIRLAEIDELDGTPREVAESGQAQYGQLLNTWRAIMNKPELFGAYLPFLRQVAGPGVLDMKIKDLSALYVGFLNHCQYTASHRSTSGLKNGVTPEQMVSAVAGEWSGFDDRTRIALAFTRELTLNPQTVTYEDAPQAVSSETLTALRNEFSDVEILELSMSVSVWNALSRFHRVMGFDLDMPEAPEGVNPK
jgi:alkylhydroperoxidase family enzyme